MESDGRSSDSFLSVHSLVFEGKDNVTINAKLWHLTPDKELQTFGQSRIRPGYQAVQNGAFLSSKPAPLVILVHGSGGSAESMAWLALGLAKQGAIVVAADHPLSANGNPSRRSILDLWEQPTDVSLIIDQLSASDWSTKIDLDRINLVGFSLGGTSALMLTGARLEMEKFPSFCSVNDDGACRAFRKHFPTMDAAYYETVNNDYSDARIKTSVAIAPGFTETMRANSIQKLISPTLIITADSDQQLPPKTHMKPIRDAIELPNEYIEIKGAQHFSFLPLCGPNASKVLAETNEEFVCEEVGEKTREAIHAEVLENIVAFQCKNDQLDKDVPGCN